MDTTRFSQLPLLQFNRKRVGFFQFVGSILEKSHCHRALIPFNRKQVVSILFLQIQTRTQETEINKETTDPIDRFSTLEAPKAKETNITPFLSKIHFLHHPTNTPHTRRRIEQSNQKSHLTTQSRLSSQSRGGGKGGNSTIQKQSRFRLLELCLSSK